MLFRVLLAALLVILVQMGPTSSTPVCRSPCKPAAQGISCLPRHVSELKDSSVARWSLEAKSSEHGRHSYEEAKCSGCDVAGMVAKPITIQVMFLQRHHNGSDHWCYCPRELAVGCTCVKE